MIAMGKLNEEVLGEKHRKLRGVAKQVLAEAARHVCSVFGFKLMRAPRKHFPQPKFKDCFYLVRTLGTIHSIYLSLAVADDSVLAWIMDRSTTCSRALFEMIYSKKVHRHSGGC